jgi:serine/threonine protein kinase
MPVPLQPVELLDWLERNQFLTAHQVHELRPLLAKFADARALAADLIQRNWVTPYQVNQILLDRGDQLVLGALRLRERLGEGSMGQVFKAWHLRLERDVAVKTIHKNLVARSRAMERFRQEIETASQVHHPNIANVLDAGEIDGRPFLVMDYIEGTNLSQLVKTRGPMPVSVAVECIRQAALGLQHAFERGVVHRDVKPGNLMLQARGPRVADICVKMLDFGLARFDSERQDAPRLTFIGSTLGTVDYMAPEQAESARDADTRADVYGLGCTLYFLLAGRPPFGGVTLADKLGARLTCPPPSVRAVRPEVPEELERVLVRMMARWPDDRYQTPAEVAAALAPFAEDTAPPAEGVVPPMELDERVPLAMPVAPEEQRSATIPLAEPIATPPAGEGLFPVDGSNPFVDAGPATATEHTAPAKAPPTPAADRGLNLRLILPIAGGAILLFLLCLGCGGYFVVSWLKGGGTPNGDAYPPNANLHIIEAYLSTGDDTMHIGETKNVIVKLRRENFNGPVELALEDLPAGVVADKCTVKTGRVQEQVRITAKYGIDPSDGSIRLVARAKNLTDEKTLRFQVLPPKNAPKKGRKR